MSIENKPTQPIIITPAGGSEISNLNPVVNIDFTKAEDIYYLDNIERTTPVSGDVPIQQRIIGPDSNLGTFYYSDRLSSGRLGKIKINHLAFAGDIIEVWHATIDTPENGTVTLDRMVHSGTLDANCEFIIPYEKAERFYSLLVLLKRPVLGDKGNSVSFRGSPGFDDHLGKRVAGNHLYYYNDIQKRYQASSYNYGLQSEFYMYGGHEDDISYEVGLSLDGGQNWQSLANGVYGEPTLRYDFTDEIENNNTYLARVRVRAQDDNHFFPKAWTYTGQPIYRDPNYTEWSTSEPFTIIKHTNPEKPTNLFVSATGIIDKNIINRLSWKHNHDSINNRQGRAEIYWRLQGATEWNMIVVDGMSQFYYVPANTFPLGIIEMHIVTYSYVYMVSPPSDIVTFEAKDTPTGPTITAPSGLVNEPSPAVAWSHTYSQTHYQINVLDVADYIVWTSGEVESTALSSLITKYLDNLITYKLQVRVKTNDGLWSAYTDQLFNTNYQYPAPAFVSATSSGKGYITVSYDNPEATGEQPPVVRNEVYKKVDGEWVVLSDAAPYSFNDYAAASGALNEYYVRSIAQNGVYTNSEIVSASVIVKGVVMHVVNDPENTMFQFVIDGHGRSDNWGLESQLMPYFGRNRPGIEIGELETDTIDFTLMISTGEEMKALDRIIKSRQVVCYRDGRGRIAHGVFTGRPRTDQRWGGYSVELSITALDYVEGDGV